MEPQILAFPFPVSFQTLLYQSKAVRTSQTRRRSPRRRRETTKFPKGGREKRIFYPKFALFVVEARTDFRYNKGLHQAQSGREERGHEIAGGAHPEGRQDQERRRAQGGQLSQPPD